MEELGKKIDEVSNYLVQLRLEIWRKYTFLTWQWWVFVAICITCVILFFIFVDKKKYLQVIAYMGVLYILNRNLDDIATALDWYDYRMQLEPIIPTFLPANLFVVPIVYSLIYQRYEKWGAYIIGTVAFSAFIAYITLPSAKLFKIYVEKLWNVHISFVSLLIMAILSKLLIDKAKVLTERYK